MEIKKINEWKKTQGINEATNKLKQIQDAFNKAAETNEDGDDTYVTVNVNMLKDMLVKKPMYLGLVGPSLGKTNIVVKPYKTGGIRIKLNRYNPDYSVHNDSMMAKLERAINDDKYGYTATWLPNKLEFTVDFTDADWVDITQ